MNSRPFAGTADLYATGSDGEVYLRRGWVPGDASPWEQLSTVAFDPAPGEPVRVAGRQVFARSGTGVLWARDREQLVLVGGGWVSLDSPGFAVESFAVCGDDARQLLAVRGPGGQVRVGARTSGTSVAWASPVAADGWAPGAQTDLAWAVAGQDAQWLIATGVDGTVRALTATEPTWTVVGNGAPQVAAAGTRLAATARAPGQVEVFAQRPDGGLAWTWWS